MFRMINLKKLTKTIALFLLISGIFLLFSSSVRAYSFTAPQLKLNTFSFNKGQVEFSKYVKLNINGQIVPSFYNIFQDHFYLTYQPELKYVKTVSDRVKCEQDMNSQYVLKCSLLSYEGGNFDAVFIFKNVNTTGKTKVNTKAYGTLSTLILNQIVGDVTVIDPYPDYPTTNSLTILTDTRIEKPL